MERARQIESLRWPHWLCPVALLLVSWVWVTALTLRAGPGDSVVAVVFPPWWTTERTFAAAALAEASIVRVGGISSVLVVQPSAVNGLERLYRAGAWLSLNPTGIGACLAN
jgi:hypothetical protein